MHRTFLHHKNEGFHVSKCVCHYCNKIGHFISDCPIKRNAHFEAKMVWVPKTNHKGPKTKRVPNTTDFILQVPLEDINDSINMRVEIYSRPLMFIQEQKVG